MTEIGSSFSQIETRQASKVAALDIGSNSFHLVVARIVANNVQILHKVKQKVRLADGLDDNNLLSEEAIERGLDALKIIAQSLHGFAPDSVRIVATYTLRKASNAKSFIKRARQILPYPIEIISGGEEARLIYLGVAHTNHDEGKRLVVDIGGGSTEFILGQGFSPHLLRSLHMGCVSYTQRFFPQGVLKGKAFEKAITSAQQELELIDSKYQRLGWDNCIGTSGTIRTIIALANELHDTPHPQPLTLADLHNLTERACQAGHIDKLTFANLSEDRKPVFAAGLAILTAIFTSLNIKEMHYSSTALREGVLWEIEEQFSHPDIRQRTAHSLAQRYDVDTEQAQRVLATVNTLHQQCQYDWQLDDPQLHSMLGWAALLHEVGLQINTRGYQRHSAYVLQNVDMPGFNQEQQLLVATLARFQRKKIRRTELPDFAQFSEEQVIRLICLLRLAVLLNLKRQDQLLPHIALQVKKSKLTLSFPKKWLDDKPIFSADLQRETEQLEELGLQLNVTS